MIGKSNKPENLWIIFIFLAVISIRFDKSSVSNSSLIYDSAKPILPPLIKLKLKFGFFILILAFKVSSLLPNLTNLPW